MNEGFPKLVVENFRFQRGGGERAQMSANRAALMELDGTICPTNCKESSHVCSSFLEGLVEVR